MTDKADKDAPKKGRKRRRGRYVLAGILAFCVGVYVMWTQVWYPTYPLRYRLTVEVQTPDGLKSGSSVIEARYGWEPTLFGLISGVKNRLTGEAVFVDLGGGKNLVVTLINRHSGRQRVIYGPLKDRRDGALSALYLPRTVFDVPYDKTQTPIAIEEARQAGERDVPFILLPTIVTFVDVNDPKSVKLVQPDDLQATFGPGFKMASAKMRVTDEALTDSIEARLQWLGDLRARGARLNGKKCVACPMRGNLRDLLGVGDFVVEKR